MKKTLNKIWFCYSVQNICIRVQSTILWNNYHNNLMEIILQFSNYTLKHKFLECIQFINGNDFLAFIACNALHQAWSTDSLKGAM